MLNKIIAKKTLEFESTFSANYEFYVCQHLVAIKKNTIDSKLHMLTNKTCTFLFYNFNFNRCGDPIQKVRHKIISENKHRIVKLQKQDWLYFKENLLEVSEKKLIWKITELKLIV